MTRVGGRLRGGSFASVPSLDLHNTLHRKDAFRISYLLRTFLSFLVHIYGPRIGATKHRIGYIGHIGVQIMLLLDMTQYKVVKGKRLGSVLVKQFSRAQAGWGLERAEYLPRI